MAKRLLTVTLAIMLVFVFSMTATANTAQDFVDAEGDDGAETGMIRNVGEFNSDMVNGRLIFDLRNINRGDGDNYSFFEFVGEEFEDGEYKIVVGFSADAAAEFRLSTPGSPWRVWTKSANVASGELSLDVTVEDNKFISNTNWSDDEGTAVAADPEVTFNFVRFTVEGDGSSTPSQPVVTITKMQVFKGSTLVFDVYGIDEGGNGGNGENGGGNGANGGVDGDKKPVDTGIAGVAVASAVALLAAGAVVISRKRK
jgi:hypothetical protein